MILASAIWCSWFQATEVYYSLLFEPVINLQTSDSVEVLLIGCDQDKMMRQRGGSNQYIGVIYQQAASMQISINVGSYLDYLVRQG
jgi:hypothetical protein